MINEILIPRQKTIETGQKQKILFKPTIWFHIFPMTFRDNCVPLPQMENQIFLCPLKNCCPYDWVIISHWLWVISKNGDQHTLHYEVQLKHDQISAPPPPPPSSKLVMHDGKETVIQRFLIFNINIAYLARGNDSLFTSSVFDFLFSEMHARYCYLLIVNKLHRCEQKLIPWNLWCRHSRRSRIVLR